jgi:hypothetical protein
MHTRIINRCIIRVENIAIATYRAARSAVACTPLTHLHRYLFLAGKIRPRWVTAIELNQRGHRGPEPNFNSLKTSGVRVARLVLKFIKIYQNQYSYKF